MNTRLATHEDIPQMLNIGERVYSESRFGHLSYDRDKLSSALEGLLFLQKEGSHLFLVAENSQGDIIGGFIGAVEEYFFTSDTSANSILIWVDPSYRGSITAIKMIDLFKQWGIKKGCKEINIVVASGVKIGSTDRFLRRLGFVQTGGNYSQKGV